MVGLQFDTVHLLRPNVVPDEGAVVHKGAGGASVIIPMYFAKDVLIHHPHWDVIDGYIFEDRDLYGALCKRPQPSLLLELSAGRLMMMMKCR